MRVSTLQGAHLGLDGFQANQAQLAKLQSQLSTGLRVQAPSDDPVAAAQAELARSRQAHAQFQQRAAQLATGVLATADGALAQGVDTLQRARELLVSAGNASLGAQDRQALATELQGLREQLLRVANTGDGAGGFVFGGQGALAGPLSAGSAPAYAPVAGEQHIGEGGTMATSLDGREAFIDVPIGNGVFATASAGGNTGTGWITPGSVANPNALTGHAYAITFNAGGTTYDVTDTTAGTPVVTAAAYTPGSDIVFDGQRLQVAGAPAAGDSFTVAPAASQSIFRTLDDAVALLQSGPMAAGAYAEQLQRVQTSLDRGLESLVLVRSHVGNEMNRVDAQQSAAVEAGDAATARRSDLRDADFAATVSKLQSTQAQMDAGMKAYTAISRKSLFDLLG